GFEFLKHLRLSPKFGNLPVCVITSDNLIRVEGADELLQKPLDLERLLAVVAFYCERGIERQSAWRLGEEFLEGLIGSVVQQMEFITSSNAMVVQSRRLIAESRALIAQHRASSSDGTMH